MTDRPRYVRTTFAVWEITLRCNLACRHCGSRAGSAREAELTPQEALDLVDQLAEVGIREVALIGGEAFLRADWLDIARAITKAGMVCSMTTSGYGLSAPTARRMKQAGMRHVSVSVDGLEQTHDALRARGGSFAAAIAALHHLHEAGLLVGANTQINRLSAPELPELYEQLKDAGMRAWQIQLTVPSGNAADRPEILLQPCELVHLYDVLARLAIRATRDGVTWAPGNNVGYHGPYTDLFAAAGASGAIGEGCQAGESVLGIEADGTIKGCPSLGASDYGGGNIRERRLSEMLRTSLKAPSAVLWGFCRTCEFADRCRGGCTWTAHAFFGCPGNNPYCHHRALSLAANGRRERVRQIQRAPGLPFDHGTFDLIEESSDAPWPEGDRLRFSRRSVRWPAPARSAGVLEENDGRIPG
jgi:radical SAM protein with 4Fe4S-binding SPASM domain